MFHLREQFLFIFYATFAFLSRPYSVTLSVHDSYLALSFLRHLTEKFSCLQLISACAVQLCLGSGFTPMDKVTRGFRNRASDNV